MVKPPGMLISDFLAQKCIGIAWFSQLCCSLIELYGIISTQIDSESPETCSMIKTIRIASIVVLTSIISTLSVNASAQATEKAAEQAGDVTAEPAAIPDAPAELLEQIRTRLGERLPGIGIDSVGPTHIPGLYELVTDGQIYYVDEAAEFLVDGNMIQLSNRENLTDARLGGIHMGLIKEVGEENMLIYEPAEASARSITIFTDISCGYCRRLHAELGTLLENGVRVRYLLFPRAGLGSQGHKDLESVWCADNPQEAMTNAKAGGEIEPKSCDNPIEQHVALAERVGLRGTPLIYTDSGEKVPGYREAAALAGMVNDSEPLEK